MRRTHMTAAALVTAGIALTGCGDSSQTNKDVAGTPAPANSAPAPTKPKSKADALRDALAHAKPAGAGAVDVQEIEFGKSLVVYLTTPDGGFNGPSDKDLNNSAAAAFKAIYGESKYPATKDASVVFRGGLVNSKTGKDLPKVNTGIYVLTASDARDIDWSNDDAMFNIDWSNYRLFIHPAIRQ